MRLHKYIVTAAFVMAAMLSSAHVQANRLSDSQVYIFGFAASFNDTIVHFTEIQMVDSAKIEKKTKFLLGRELYSGMLREYLNQQQMPHRTCVVFYDTNRKKLQKKYIKMRKLYAGGKKTNVHNDVRTIATSDFQFKAVKVYTDEEQEQAAHVNKKTKKNKKKRE